MYILDKTSKNILIKLNFKKNREYFFEFEKSDYPYMFAIMYAH